MLRAPFSSEFDPSEEAEGSIDPLGLQPGYERLADRLLPAVTIRMGNPRLVTAIAVGACVCENYDADAVASDEVTPPWLVFEWYVVEALVRSEAVAGVPGTWKVRRALQTQRPVSATSYLKTPSAFGFTGVFRRLAVGIGILTEDGRLDDEGYGLLTAWAKDQDLDGFIDAPKHIFREKLRRAVAQGMEKGHTTAQAGEFWRDLSRRLDPFAAGRNERKFLLNQILLRAGPENGTDMVNRLKDALVARGGVSKREEEAPFLRKLSRSVPADFKQLLAAIDAYEGFGRAITNAFDGLRHCASVNGGAPTDAQHFSSTPAAKEALAALGPSLARIRSHPALLEWERNHDGLAQAVERFDAVRNGTDLFNAVLDHHEHVQHNKPPNGKRAWLERGSRGRVVVRAGYVLPEAPDGQGAYVHEYRIPTFSRFLTQLGALR